MQWAVPVRWGIYSSLLCSSLGVGGEKRLWLFCGIVFVLGITIRLLFVTEQWTWVWRGGFCLFPPPALRTLSPSSPHLAHFTLCRFRNDHLRLFLSEDLFEALVAHESSRGRCWIFISSVLGTSVRNSPLWPGEALSLLGSCQGWLKLVQGWGHRLGLVTIPQPQNLPF